MLCKKNFPLFLTIFRLLAIFPLYSLIYFPPFDSYWLAMLFFIAVSITDSLDGFLARKWKCESFLGEMIDPVADKVLVLSSFLILVDLKHISSLIAILFLVREVTVTGIRIMATKNKISIQSHRLGKWKTGFQMTGISMLILYKPESFFHMPLPLIGTVVLLIGLVLSWISGFQYLLKYSRNFNSKSL